MGSVARKMKQRLYKLYNELYGRTWIISGLTRPGIAFILSNPPEVVNAYLKAEDEREAKRDPIIKAYKDLKSNIQAHIAIVKGIRRAYNIRRKRHIFSSQQRNV